MVRAFDVRNGVRRALREMLLCAVILMPVAWLSGKNMDGISSALIGLVFAPVLWGLYRLGRFTFSQS